MTKNTKRLPHSSESSTRRQPRTGSAKAVAYAILSNNPLFARVERRDLEDLISRARSQHFDANEVIFQKGDSGDSLYAVLDGRIGITALSREGKEIVLNILETGEVLGEIALLDGKARTAAATAMRPSTVLRIERADFIAFLESHPSMCLSTIELLCARLRWVSDTTEDLLFLDIPSRVAKRLVMLMENYGIAAQNGTHLEIKLSQETLARMTGATRERVNQVIKSLQGCGMIRYRYGKVVILDPEALRALAKETPF